MRELGQLNGGCLDGWRALGDGDRVTQKNRWESRFIYIVGLVDETSFGLCCNCCLVEAGQETKDARRSGASLR